MNDTARFEFHFDEYVNDLEERRVLSRKITCKDSSFMIINKRFPRLTALWVTP
jgi:hypothetical protein